MHWFATCREAGAHREGAKAVKHASESSALYRIFLEARCQSLMGLCFSERISDVDCNYSTAKYGWRGQVKQLYFQQTQPSATKTLLNLFQGLFLAVQWLSSMLLRSIRLTTWRSWPPSLQGN